MMLIVCVSEVDRGQVTVVTLVRDVTWFTRGRTVCISYKLSETNFNS